MFEKNKKGVITEIPVEGKEVDGQEPENQGTDDKTMPTKKSFIDRQYDKYCARRDAKALKKANKKPLTKKQKTGIAVGGGLLGLAFLGGVAKAAVDHLAQSNDSDYELEEGDVRYLEDGNETASEETEDDTVENETI